VSFLPPLTWPGLDATSAECPELVAGCYREVEAVMQAELTRLTLGRHYLRGQARA
jgi:hypothetical protein